MKLLNKPTHNKKPILYYSVSSTHEEFLQENFEELTNCSESEKELLRKHKKAIAYFTYYYKNLI